MRLRERLVSEGMATASEIERWDTDAAEEVEAAIRFARESPEPSVESAREGVYANG
jgi:pyruvate dehydrogenase E1 component alpha subunit